MSNGIFKDRDALAAQGPRVATELLRSKMVSQLVEELAEVLLIPEWTVLTAEAGGGAPANARDVRWEARRAIRTAVPAATPIAGDVDVATSGVATDPAQSNAVLNDFAGEVIVNFRSDDPNMEFSIGGGGGEGTILSGGGTNRVRVLTTTNGLVNLRCTTTTVGTVRIAFSVEDRPSLDVRVLDLVYA